MFARGKLLLLEVSEPRHQIGPGRVFLAQRSELPDLGQINAGFLLAGQVEEAPQRPGTPLEYAVDRCRHGRVPDGGGHVRSRRRRRFSGNDHRVDARFAKQHGGCQATDTGPDDWHRT